MRYPSCLINRPVSKAGDEISSLYNIPQGLDDLSQTDLALEVIAVVRRYLYQRYIERLLRREHELERHPDAMVNSAFHTLGLDSRLDQVLPYFNREVGCVLVWPIVIINEGC